MSVMLVMRISPESVIKWANSPNRTFVVNVGESGLNAASVDLNLIENEDSRAAIKKIVDLLVKSVVLDPEYMI